MPHDPHMTAPHQQCKICANLSDQEDAYQKHGWEQENTHLPAAADRLKVVRDFWPTAAANCSFSSAPSAAVTTFTGLTTSTWSTEARMKSI